MNVRHLLQFALVSLVTFSNVYAQIDSATTKSMDGEVSRYLFNGRDASYPPTWQLTEAELAGTLIESMHDPRFTSPQTEHGDSAIARFSDLIITQVKDQNQRLRITAAILTLIREVKDPLTVDRLVGLTIGTGGEPSVIMLRMVVDGTVKPRDERVVNSLISAVQGDLIDANQRTALFDLVKVYGKKPNLEVMAYLDAERLADHIQTERMLSPSHPEHLDTLQVAVDLQIEASEKDVLEFLDGLKLTSQAVKSAKGLLQLLARVNPVEATARARKILASVDNEPQLSALDRRRWKALALQCLLETRGINVSVSGPWGHEFRAVRLPKSIQTIQRVTSLASDVRPDIGRYFFERDKLADGKADVAALRDIGAQQTADLLQTIIDAVGPKGFSADAGDRVEAVRSMNQALGVQLNVSMQAPPDELALLTLQYQLDHEADVKQWLAEFNTIRNSIDTNRVKDRRILLSTDADMLSLSLFRRD